MASWDSAASRASRRAFIHATALAAAGASLARRAGAEPQTAPPAAGAAASDSPPSATSAITEATFEEAEKLAGISFTMDERRQMVASLKDHTDLLHSLSDAPYLPNGLAPACVFRAQLADLPAVRVTTEGDPMAIPPGSDPLPVSDEDLAFAPVWQLARWVRDRKVTSRRLTELALERLRRADPKLFCVITLTADVAREQADQADREIAAGGWRGPLHGIPWGCKDIIDTAGIRTTWGAEPWRDRVPDSSAVVVDRLSRAGAVLVAKLAVGALAYGDIWFGGTCRNPWNPEKGSSGSSAGSACAVAAGLVPFALGTETLGSIVSPCTRCGATGLRPTFGRVARNGAMALVWSMDKIGSISRCTRDCAIVLSVINGADPGDPSSVQEPFSYHFAQGVKGLRIGYDSKWLHPRGRNPSDPDEESPPDSAAAAPKDPGTDPVFFKVLSSLRAAGCEVQKIDLDLPDPAPLTIPLLSEAAAAFEEMTRSNKDDELSWQAPQAWPNTFRRTWFLPAIDLVQADRMRRRAMVAANRLFAQVDAIVAPPFGNPLLLTTNSTGQPCLVIRAAIDAKGQPQSTTIMGRLFDEGTLCRIGAALEAQLRVADARPKVELSEA